MLTDDDVTNSHAHECPKLAGPGGQPRLREGHLSNPQNARRPYVKALSIAAPLALVAALLSAPSVANADQTCSVSESTVTCVFTFTGAPEAWLTPPGVTQIDATVYGAQGGDVGDNIWTIARGGWGGSAKATLETTPGETLLITVGGQGGKVGACNAQTTGGAGGFNGGGVGGAGPEIHHVICEAGGGGGATDIRRGGSGLQNRVLVAGGGGGAAHYEGTLEGPGPANGGTGGGLTGGNAALYSESSGTGGLGGTQVRDDSVHLGQGTPGKDSWSNNNEVVTQPGGGGGGGYHGGHGGSTGYTTFQHSSWGMIEPPLGGGGGSGFGPEGWSGENGVRAGNGEAIIRYPAVAVSGQSATTTHNSVTLTAVVATNGRTGLPMQVNWGLSPDSLIYEVDVAPVGGPTTDTASVMLSGLNPDTQYYFQFVVPGEDFASLEASSSFRTAVEPPEDDGGDTGGGDEDGGDTGGGDGDGGTGDGDTGGGGDGDGGDGDTVDNGGTGGGDGGDGDSGDDNGAGNGDTPDGNEDGDDNGTGADPDGEDSGNDNDNNETEEGDNSGGDQSGGQGPGDAATPVPGDQLTEKTRGGVRAPPTVTRGQQFNLQVGSAHAGKQVRVWLHSTPTLLGKVVVDATGNTRLTVPSGAELGEHRIVVQTLNDALIGWDNTRVIAVSQSGQNNGQLPGTGTATASVSTALAVSLLLLGITSMLVSTTVRKRNHTETKTSLAP